MPEFMQRDLERDAEMKSKYHVTWLDEPVPYDTAPAIYGDLGAIRRALATGEALDGVIYMTDAGK